MDRNDNAPWSIQVTLVYIHRLILWQHYTNITVIILSMQLPSPCAEDVNGKVVTLAVCALAVTRS